MANNNAISTPAFNDLIKTATTAKEVSKTTRAKTEAEYKPAFSSGASFALDKHLKSKDYRLAALFDLAISEDDENKPLRAYIEDMKDGSVKEVNEQTLKLFCAQAPDRGICESLRGLNPILDVFNKSSVFVKGFVGAINSPVFSLLAKHGLMTIGVWCKQYNGRYNNDITGWWGWRSRSICTDSFLHSEYLAPAVIKLVKYALKRQEELLGVDHRAALYALMCGKENYYSNEEYLHFMGLSRQDVDACKIVYESIRAFILIMNRYGMDKAKRWVDIYLTNNYLEGLNGDSLAHIFTANSDTNDCLHDLMWVPDSELDATIRQYIKVNYDVDTLEQYLFSYSLASGYSDRLGDMTSNLASYLNLCMTLWHKVSEKYPQPLSEELNKLKCMERRIDALAQMQFEWPKIMKVTQTFEAEYGKYKLISPKNTQDIVEEGSVLRHCVATRVDGMLKGKYYVMFLRLKDKPEERLVTVQLTPEGRLCTTMNRDGAYEGDNTRLDGNYNFRGLLNREPTPDEKTALKNILNKIQDKITKDGVDHLTINVDRDKLAREIKHAQDNAW